MNIRERDAYRCRACGSTRNLHTHHIVFRSRGGGDEPENLITLCAKCHRRAHNLERDPIAPEELSGLLELGMHSITRYRTRHPSFQHLKPEA